MEKIENRIRLTNFDFTQLQIIPNFNPLKVLIPDTTILILNSSNDAEHRNSRLAFLRNLFDLAGIYQPVPDNCPDRERLEEKLRETKQQDDPAANQEPEPAHYPYPLHAAFWGFEPVPVCFCNALIICRTGTHRHLSFRAEPSFPVDFIGNFILGNQYFRKSTPIASE